MNPFGDDLHARFGLLGQEGEDQRQEMRPSPFQTLEESYQHLERLLSGSANAQPDERTIQRGVDDPDLPSATQQLTDLLEGRATQIRDFEPNRIDPFSAEILKFSKQLQALCQADVDATLGAIHLGIGGERYSIRHALSRALVCELLATRCRIPPRNRLHLMAAALTCDISILQLQDDLSNQEGPLRPEQRQAIDEHPLEAVELLASRGVVDPSWTNAVIQHHELPNGKGYPANISGNVISPWARILKFADIYTAMISPRAYRKALLSKMALRQLFLRRGSELDEELAGLFVKEIGVFPPGLFVRLQNGETAAVIRRGEISRAPIVSAVVGPRGARYYRPITRHTEIREYAIVDVVDAVVGIDPNPLWGYRS